MTGTVTAADGSPVPDVVVRLSGRFPGQQWTRIARARADAQGRVSLTTPPLTQNVALRWVTAQGVRSASTRVVVVPVLQASVDRDGSTSVISVTALGAQGGDEVFAYRRQDDRLVLIGSVVLDATGSATVRVDTPKRPVRVVLRIRATAVHGKAQAVVVVGRVPEAAEPEQPEQPGVDGEASVDPARGPAGVTARSS